MIELDSMLVRLRADVAPLLNRCASAADARAVADKLTGVVAAQLGAALAKWAVPGGRWDAAPAPAPECLLGSSVQPATFTLDDGEVVPLGDVVAEAHKRTGLSVEEWNAQPADVIEQLIADVVAELPLAPPDDPPADQVADPTAALLGAAAELGQAETKGGKRRRGAK